jgi:subtilisin family serine protease
MTAAPARLLLLSLAFCLQAVPAAALKFERLARFYPASGKTSQLEVASGSALVRFKAGVSTTAALGVLEGSGFRVASTFERFNWSVVSFPEGMGVGAALNLLSSLTTVEWAEPNRVFRARRVPGDPFVGTQYALSLVQAFGAWEYETGVSSRVTVAMIDTGIDGAHPELSGKLVGTSRAFTPTASPVASNNQPPTQACNHATRAAGVAAAASDNGVGVAGMSWEAKLLSLKVFADSDCPDDCISGSCGTTENAIAAAIDDVVGKHNTATYGKVVINISLGSVGTCSPALQTAVTAAVLTPSVMNRLLIFAAVGNEGYGYMDSPANCTGVYAVGATDSADALASFSNTDPDMATKGLTAPGVGVYTTDINGSYASATGTSFSSPMTAGLAALVWSAKPSYSAAQVFDTLKNSADDLGAPGPDGDYGYGRINAMKALRLAVTGTEQFPGTRKAVAYPNPFRPKTHRRVTFTIPEQISASGLEIKVYTSEGELVKKLDSPSWDGRNEAGVMVASGVYLFRVKTGKDAAVGRFALLK